MTFSEFIRNATPEEKERVYRRVIELANAAQQKLLDARKRHEAFTREVP